MMCCWIISIIIGLLCAFLGYFLGKYKSNKKIEKCEYKSKKLEKKLKECEALKTEVLPLKKQSFVSKSDPVKKPSFNFDANVAKTVFGKKIKVNDLTIVEGIGPKIKELFHSFNIKTWEELSNTNVEHCQEILNSGGKGYKIHNPSTWPKQAKFASEGKWKELLQWQHKLKGGVDK